MSEWSQRPDALERFRSTHSKGGPTDADHALARLIYDVMGGGTAPQ